MFEKCSVQHEKCQYGDSWCLWCLPREMSLGILTINTSYCNNQNARRAQSSKDLFHSRAPQRRRVESRHLQFLQQDPSTLRTPCPPTGYGANTKHVLQVSCSSRRRCCSYSSLGRPGATVQDPETPIPSPCYEQHHHHHRRTPLSQLAVKFINHNY